MSETVQKKVNWPLRIVFCAALLVFGYSMRRYALPRFPCSAALDRSVLDRSLELGKQFLIRSQSAEGNFRYFFDWRNPDRPSPEGDNQVRQAGALWGLALIYQDSPAVETAYAVENGFRFYRKNSRLLDENTRMPVYPGDVKGATGTVALVTLAYIDYLRSAEHALPPEDAALLRAELGQYLNFLRSLERPDGLWYGNYSYTNGKGFGLPSPYSDGEALLVYAKAAKYSGFDALQGTVLSRADSGIKSYISRTLETQALSDLTKGYYQWSSMALYELATSGWPGTEKYSQVVIDLARWMIDVHKTLDRGKNTGYAYEGILHALALARQKHDTASEEKFTCTAEKGLEKLSSMQLGNPLQNEFITKNAKDDSPGLGGVQNGAETPELRIDVTQHQMHAVILARKYLFTGALPGSRG